MSEPLTIESSAEEIQRFFKRHMAAIKSQVPPLPPTIQSTNGVLIAVPYTTKLSSTAMPLPSPNSAQ